mgnify:CR=1 FL=1
MRPLARAHPAAASVLLSLELSRGILSLNMICEVVSWLSLLRLHRPHRLRRSLFVLFIRASPRQLYFEAAGLIFTDSPTPPPIKKKVESKKYNLGKVAENLEGKYRPGHFDGVATVVDKLLNIINPHIAFFGKKDLQQLQVIKKLVEITDKNIDIVGVKTVRESNGLAKSSRNKLLLKEEKIEASIIFECLQYCKLNRDSEIKDLKLFVEKQFLQHQNIKLEYVEFVDLNTFDKITEWGESKTNAICIAAYIGNVRLIDNIIL